MNRDYKRRDEILFGGYDPKRYMLGGCARCDIPAETLKTLIKEGFIDLHENQNESPTTEDFINSVDGCEEFVTFEAYAIGPERDDYRVTIEGIDVDLPQDRIDDFVRFVEEFRYADEFNADTTLDGLHLRAWWD